MFSVFDTENFIGRLAIHLESFLRNRKLLTSNYPLEHLRVLRPCLT